MVRTLPLLPLLALLGACAHGAGAAARGGDLWVVGPLGAEGRVSPGQVQGPTMNLARAGDEVRGTVQGSAVLLRLGEDAVTGMVGGKPVNLTVRPAGEGLAVQGLFAGHLTSLVTTPERLEGQAGPCNYTLQAVDGGYEGLRSCGGMQQRAALTFPGDVWRSRAEQGAFLALLLTPHDPRR